MDEHIPDTPHEDDIPPQSSDGVLDDQGDQPAESAGWKPDFEDGDDWGGDDWHQMEHPPVTGSWDPREPVTGVKYQPPAFEDLTLGEALVYLLLRPIATGRRLWRVLTHTADDGARSEAGREDRDAGDTDEDGDHGGPWDGGGDVVAGPVRDAVGDTPDAPLPREWAMTWSFDDVGNWFADAAGQLLSVSLLLLAVWFAVRGGWKLHHATLDPLKHLRFDTDGAEYSFMRAGVIVLAWALFEGRNWWAKRFPRVAAWLRDRFQISVQLQTWTRGLAFLALMIMLWVLEDIQNVTVSTISLLVSGALWIVVFLIQTVPDDVASTAPTDADTGAEQAPGDLPDESQRAERSRLRRGFDTARAWMIANAAQIALIPVAVLFSLLTYSENVNTDANGVVFDVVITTSGAWAWLLSVIVWIVVLGVDVRGLDVRVRALLERMRGWSRREVDWAGMVTRAVRRIDWPLIALVVIIVVGAWFRLLDLEQTPPEMTSDHIEKLLDAVKVHDGYYAVFFPNNGGREAFQMYVVEFIADELGVGFNFNALKWATVIEGVLTLPAVWWMAQQVIGTDTEDRRQLGRWVGVGMAGLLALSSWHLMLSRLGLRIALTPLTTALVIGFTARVIRHDRMRDWLALGVMLGVGVYFYQANRMLPLIVAAGVGLALLATVRRWRDVLRMVGVGLLVIVVALAPLALLARTGDTARDLLPFLALVWWAGVALWLRGGSDNGHIAIRPYEGRQGTPSTLLGGALGAAVVALVLIIPMYHYTELYPDQFWNRTRGRLYGENAFVRPDTNGVLVAYDPTLREQWDRFWDQRDVFEENYYDALRMYHWEGDGGWISNLLGYPALGAVMGGLLILGVILGGVWVLRERDWIMLLVPASVLIMLLPSALTLAYTIENPSFTRASGTIPPIFMLAGLPLGLVFWRLNSIPWRAWGVPLGGLAALLILVGVWDSAIDWNRENFYTDYHLSYSRSWKPYREIAKPLRAFAEGEGSFGNAFYVHYTHWLDHRVLGAMAGDILWPNGLVSREQLVPMVLRNQGTPYEYDPAKPLFVMVHMDDPDTRVYLEELFPGGSVELYEYTWETGVDEISHGSFYIYTVMAGDLVGAGQ